MIDQNLAYWADMFPDIKKSIEKLQQNYDAEKAKNIDLIEKLAQKDQQIANLNKKINVLKQKHLDFDKLKRQQENMIFNVTLTDSEIWDYWKQYLDTILPDYTIPHPDIVNSNIEYISHTSRTDEIKKYMLFVKHKLHTIKKQDIRFDNFDTIQQLLIKISFTKM